ncbi:MAG: histidinol-phosphatase [Phycisphaerales bacterium]|nr:histidinol-phosphatase [Phycisphaerales bacterium]
MLATYHCHSTFSDGRDDLPELVARARAAGVRHLGISDHLTILPQGGPTPPWSVDAARVGAYVDAVRAEQTRDDITVLASLEVDWFPEPHVLRALDAAMNDHDWDYLIGSVHYVGAFGVDASADRWRPLGETERDDIHRRYWIEIANLARSRRFDIVGHIDLPKKFNCRPRTVPHAEIDAALDAVADADLVVELNTAGWHKPCQDAYPTLDLLRACHARHIPVTLSSDAHRAEHLLRDFRAAADRLAAAGYDRVARFRAGARTFEPLADAVAGLPDPTGDVQLDDF